MGYGVYRGDYGRSRYYRGDPGIFGTLGKVIGGAAKLASQVIPGPAGAAMRVATRVLGGATGVSTPSIQRQVMPTMPAIPMLPIMGGGRGKPKPVKVDPQTGEVKRSYRRMQVTNPKALRRAIRRQAGFVKLARKALQGTGYTIVSRGSRRTSRVQVSEHGPGSVTVRR